MVLLLGAPAIEVLYWCVYAAAGYCRKFAFATALVQFFLAGSGFMVGVSSLRETRREGRQTARRVLILLLAVAGLMVLRSMCALYWNGRVLFLGEGER